MSKKNWSIKNANIIYRLGILLITTFQNHMKQVKQKMIQKKWEVLKEERKKTE